MIKITVNGVEVEADPTKPLIHACHQNGADVPMYCYHPGLSPVGSCRICQVEVKQGEAPPRVVVACRTPVAEGMIVDTEAPKAHETRRECLEFLLKNHPLDCPICDKAGECTLQDFSFAEGQAASRTVEPRRKLEKRKSLGDTIVLDEERCILCSRCVRFMEEVPKTPQLTVANLGSRSVINTFFDRPLTGNYQGNLADVCPVGALTLKKFRFQARVWNLRKAVSTCGECSRGCSTKVEVLRGGEVKRIRPRENEQVNGWWMCDTGRFAIDRYNTDTRLAGYFAHDHNRMESVALEEALRQTSDMLSVADQVTLLVSPWVTNEEADTLLELARATGATPTYLAPAANDLADAVLHTGDPAPNRSGLEERGFKPCTPEEAATHLASGDVGVLAGERIGELLGENLGELASTRLVLLDVVALAHGRVRVALAFPFCIEKKGSWTNVDGHSGRLTPARQAPPGVTTMEAVVGQLSEALSQTAATPETGAPR